jgi:hypothetical protein
MKMRERINVNEKEWRDIESVVQVSWISGGRGEYSYVSNIY